MDEEEKKEIIQEELTQIQPPVVRPPAPVRDTLTSLPSNSHKVKTGLGADKVKPQAVATGKVAKKGLGKRFKDLFVAENLVLAGNYVVQDVVKPTFRATLRDLFGGGMVGGAIEALLFGDVKRTPPRSDPYWATKTSYGSYYNQTNAQKEAQANRTGRTISHDARVRQDFNVVEFDTRAQAENVRDHLLDMCIDHGSVTVADFYDLSGVESTFADESWGWIELKGVRCEMSRGGYVLTLPRPKPLGREGS